MTESRAAFIGIGSNLNDPARQVRRAIDALSRSRQMQLTAVSSLYRTPPVGDTEQPDFCNAVARIKTDLSAGALFDVLEELEQRAGRTRDTRRWGPRVLDLDLLLFGETQLESSELTLPHARMHERAFVLVPLVEIAPDIVIPGLGRAAKYLDRLDRDKIVPIKSS